MVNQLQTRIMQNGSKGWYWEVGRNASYDVIARGIADTHAQARADAARVLLDVDARKAA